MRITLKGFLVTLVLVAAAACGGPTVHQITSTTRAPGADGKVTVEKVSGGNRLLKVELQHLPPPSSISQGATVFVVWFQSSGGIPIRAGTLGYDEKKRTGEMQATSPGSGSMTILITAEKAAGAAAPSEVVVVKRTISS